MDVVEPDPAVFFATHGNQIREVTTDDAMHHRLSRDLQNVIAALGAPPGNRAYSPRRNGKAERFNPTIQ